MNFDQAMIFTHITEKAAIATLPWIGNGDKNKADDAAVQEMRRVLNNSNINGEIVIGEGEIDNAPMLYIGEKVGKGGPEIDIAVDPIEGTRMTALGQSNAVCVLAAGKKDSLLKAPDMYMEKLVVNSLAKDHIDINLPIEENIQKVSSVLQKKIEDMVITILDKPRHHHVIQKIRNLGAKVFLIPDGDVIASIQICMQNMPGDIMYGIGGAPEGVISAAAVHSLGGNMQAKLIPRNKVKGANLENDKISLEEIKRCKELNLKTESKLLLSDLVTSSSVLCAVTGITKGDILDGVSVKENMVKVDTLLIIGETKSIHRLTSQYELN